MATVSSAVNKTSYTIAKFEELHGDTYIYTDVDYIGAKEEVKENTDAESYVLTVKQPIGDSLQINKREVLKREDIIN